LFRRLGHQFNARWILLGFPSIVFVVGQAGKAEQAVGDVVGAFGGKKVAMMDAPHSGHHFNPLARVALESRDLVGVNDVPDMASNHGLNPLKTGKNGFYTGYEACRR
jgi:hypothetical protein